MSILTNDNYFSPPMLKKYFSVSQYKDFIGTTGQKGCEAMAMAKIRGEWSQDLTTALLVGNYVDSHFSGTLDIFKAQNRSIYKQDGELKMEFQHANEIIRRIEEDPLFMKFLTGETQVILTGEIFGVPWKCKIDCLDSVRITDLKIMKCLRDLFWVRDAGHMSFVQYWGYDIQGAIYQKLVEINFGKKLPFYIAGASKEIYPDIEIIGFTQMELDDALSLIEPNIQRIKGLKEGLFEPDRCGSCNYCRHTKILERPIHWSELTADI